MGLDLYAFRVSKSVADKYGLSITSDFKSINSALEKEGKKLFKAQCENIVADLEKAYKEVNDVDYEKSYHNFILQLKENVSFLKEYPFYLRSLGYDNFNGEFIGIKTPTDVKEFLEKLHNDYVFGLYQAYFRKVNFIFQFFSDEMIDNYYAVVSKSRINDLIKSCDEVLKDNTKAEEILPTTSGFFFGSTDYDKYYFEDVKNCKEQMKKLHSTMSNDDFVLWHFSW